ncbi:MAG: hypothetical protein HY237_14245 [Acidobacteria bacterium]|nr:hypothetical protein [Acidobacteriota bacterium]
MRFRQLLLVVVLGLSCCVSVAAQQPQRDPQALQILYQSFVAMGGLRKAQIVDVRVEGTLASPSAPDAVIGTFVAKARGSDISTETNRSGELRSYRVLQGFGSVRTKNGIKPLPPYDTRGLTLDILPLFAKWAEFLQSDVVVRPPRLTAVDGRACFAIAVENKNEKDAENEATRNEHGKVEVLVDTVTGLAAAMRYRATLGPHSSDRAYVENTFADYRDFGGVLLPTKITRSVSGNPVLIINVNSVQFNNGFADSDFKN